jgi:hypothetical protein
MTNKRSIHIVIASANPKGFVMLAGFADKDIEELSPAKPPHT